jgi:hypothetical protein
MKLTQTVRSSSGAEIWKAHPTLPHSSFHTMNGTDRLLSYSGGDERHQLLCLREDEEMIAIKALYAQGKC